MPIKFNQLLLSISEKDGNSASNISYETQKRSNIELASEIKRRRSDLTNSRLVNTINSSLKAFKCRL